MKKIVFAEKIYSMEKEDEFFTCMIIEGNKIIELSHKTKSESNLDNFDEILEYPDKTIIPGFNDSHIHVLHYGIFLDNVNLVGCVSKNDFLARIKEKVDETPTGMWIQGRGWDQERFSEREYPNRFELDTLSKDHPMIIFRHCGHIAVVNSAAFSISGISKTSVDPTGGVIDRDTNGNPIGILRETAIDLVATFIPESNLNFKRKRLESALKRLNEYGITSAHANDGNIHEIYQSLGEKLTVRTYLTPFIKELDDLSKLGVKTTKSDSLIRWGRIKIFADGSLGGETAAVKEPFEGGQNKGVLIHSYPELVKLCKNAHVAGWQIETHAIGDYAAELVVNAYEEVGAYTNRAVLTHCQILNKELVKKMANLKIIANIQPAFINTDLHWAEKKIGKTRMKFSYAWKTLLNNNIHCAGGSDAPIENPNPILGIHAAVNRQDSAEYPAEGWYIDEALSIYEAVKLFTIDSAFAEFQEDIKGKLKKGMFADFIVLNQDIFSIVSSEILKTTVLATFVNGQKVFSS